ncbi:CDP-glycerol glycerophosphotransferase family protein [Mesobacillus foraminis]|uniref:CDP-glycerol glycerophosphotransferase family protein n=1 Tax=Mesobacillus foraminis TaxID=279826 RepID=UPI0039A321BE
MNVKLIPTLMVKYLIRTVFFMSCLLFPVNQKKVTFASYRSGKLEGNLLYIHEEFRRRDEGHQYHFLFKKYQGSLMGKLNYVMHMLQASHAVATSRYFIIDDFYFPVYAIKPRKGTDIVQLWHAAGAFKKFGYSTIGKSFGPSREYLKHIKVHSNYTRVYVSSRNIIPHYAEAFDMPEENIYPLGLPRTDFFFKEEAKESIRREFNIKFPEFKNKKLLLYAPTFRGSSHSQGKFTSPIDIPLLKKMAGEEFALLIHLHPYMKSGLKIDNEDREFACHIEGQFTIEELLTVTDVLITDYSSIIFDYSLLGRPIVFFAADLEDYIKERDFYFDYKSFIPGPLMTETHSLARWLVKGNYDMKKVSDFRNFFFDYQDGRASERIVTHLLNKEPKQHR